MIISQDTTISAGQTLNITDKLQIAPGATLRVEAGASIVGGTLQVYGNLDIAGSPNNRVEISGTSIIFSDNNNSPGRVAIDYVDWNYGGLLPATGNGSYGSFSLTNSLMRGTSKSYIWYPTADSKIEGNIFLSMGGLSIGTSKANISVMNNIFTNTYDNYNGSATIVNWANYGRQINVEHNAFLGMGAALEVSLGYSNAAMTAYSNWFGTSDAAIIMSRILDRSDDLSRSSYIPFQPFLTSPDQVAPSSNWFKLGTAGDDTIVSDASTPGQYLIGGGGLHDSFVVHSSADRVIPSSFWYGDVIYADDTDFSLAVGAQAVSTLVLRGSGHFGSGNDLYGSMYGHDNIYSYGDNNTLLGGSGNDTLYSYGHSNSLYGGIGDDSYVVTTRDTFVYEELSQAGGNDTVYADDIDFSLSLSANNVETLVILSSNHIGAGTESADRLTAYGANDTLIGGGGDDTLSNFGNSGTLAGGTGNDIYVVVDRGTKILEDSDAGNDTVYADGIDFSLGDAQNIEALVLRGNNHVGAGTNGSDLLISQGVSNQLFGGGGNDTFSFTPSHGATQILDFNARPGEHDVAAFTTAQFANFAAVKSHLAQVGADSVITAADSTGDTFILKNVVAANLTAADFLFV